MKYSDFIATAKALGDQNLAEADRWKSLAYVYADNHMVIDFKNLYAQGRIYFVDNGEDGPNGFVLSQSLSAEFMDNTAHCGDDTVSFINLDCVEYVAFDTLVDADKFDYDIDKVTAAFGITLSPTVAFTEDSYTVKFGDALPNILEVSEPVKQGIYVYASSADRTTATTAMGGGTDVDTGIVIKEPGTYYLLGWAFTDDTYTYDTATLTVE